VGTVQPTQVSFALGQEWVDILTVPRKAVLSETRSFFDEEGTEYQYEQYYVYVATSSLGLFGEVYDAERINVTPFPIEAYSSGDYQPETGALHPFWKRLCQSGRRRRGGVWLESLRGRGGLDASLKRRGELLAFGDRLGAGPGGGWKRKRTPEMTFSAFCKLQERLHPPPSGSQMGSRCEASLGLGG